jgi:hypothetical protein
MNGDTLCFANIPGISLNKPSLDIRYERLDEFSGESLVSPYCWQFLPTDSCENPIASACALTLSAVGGMMIFNRAKTHK